MLNLSNNGAVNLTKIFRLFLLGFHATLQRRKNSISENVVAASSQAYVLTKSKDQSVIVNFQQKVIMGLFSTVIKKEYS